MVRTAATGRSDAVGHREVARLSENVDRRWGFGVDVRIGVHSGPVYLAADPDRAHQDFAGSTANQAVRISGLASPGAVVISPELQALIGDDFDVQAQSSSQIGDSGAAVFYHRVLGERSPTQ